MPQIFTELTRRAVIRAGGMFGLISCMALLPRPVDVKAVHKATAGNPNCETAIDSRTPRSQTP